MDAPAVSSVDPFDLPEWLGRGEVTWTAVTSVHGGHLVSGVLSAQGETLDCDLLGVDQAFPAPVLNDDWRRQSHQAWTHGQVLVVERDGRLTLAVPGTGFTADRALEALGRLAKAVGAKPGSYLAAIRL